MVKTALMLSQQFEFDYYKKYPWHQRTAKTNWAEKKWKIVKANAVK